MADKYYYIDKDRVLKSLDRSKEFKVGIPYKYDTFVKVYPEYFIEIKEEDETITLIIDGGNSILEDEFVELDVNKLYIQKEIKKWQNTIIDWY